MEGCLGRASNWTNLWVQFLHGHAQDKIVTLEEGNQPYPRCPQCDMFVSCKALNRWHMKTAFFRHSAERKRRYLVEEEARAGAETAFT